MSGNQSRNLPTADDDRGLWSPDPDEPLSRGDQLREGLGTIHDADPDDEGYPRENYFGDLEDSDDTGGHSEVRRGSRAEQKARELILRFVQPLCQRSLDDHDEVVELSDPAVTLPKQTEVRPGVFVEYCQHRLRRRVNEQRGYITFGETTSTTVPEIDHETYCLCCDLYLVERYQRAARDTDDGLRVTEIDAYQDVSEALWWTQDLNSHEALARFIDHVREEENGQTGE